HGKGVVPLPAALGTLDKSHLTAVLACLPCEPLRGRRRQVAAAVPRHPHCSTSHEHGFCACPILAVTVFQHCSSPSVCVLSSRSARCSRQPRASPWPPRP